MRLANGIKIVLKPTDFSKDEILIDAFSFGGTSLAPDSDYLSASFSPGIIGSSGINDITEEELEKKLSDKNVIIVPYITETTQGISGNCSKKDLETALQLVHSYFTKPRIDENIWQSQITQTKASLVNRYLDPASVFQDTVAAVLGNHNYRQMPLTPERLSAISSKKGFDFYKARFADASGFTFCLVGSFDVEKIKPLLQKYLGGLPANGKIESYKTLDSQETSGPITKTIYKGIGEKSYVQLVFNGDYDYNNDLNLQIDALTEILNNRLIERLRNKEHGVYLPGVKASYTKIPASRYALTVYFTCVPKNAEKLIDATMDEIQELKNHGAKAGDIQKYKEDEKRSLEVKLHDNFFWANQLILSIEYNENPDSILNRTGNLEQITPQSIKNCANQLLKSKNLIKFILLPEKKENNLNAAQR